MSTSTAARTGVPRTAREASTCKDSFREQRGSPLLNRLYSARSRVMHHVMHFSLQALASTSSSGHKQQNPGLLQLVLIGAGLDVSYDHLKVATSEAHTDKKTGTGASAAGTGTDALPMHNSHLKVYAVDFPEVLQERALLLRNTNTNTNTNNQEDVLATHVPADLRQPAAVREQLLAHGLQPFAPTLFLSEMVLNYLPPEAVAGLVHTLTRQTLHASVPSLWVSYDVHSLCPPAPAASSTSSSSSCMASMGETISAAPLSPSSFVQYLQAGFTAREAPLLLLPGGSNALQCSAVGGYRGGNLLATLFTSQWPCAFVRPIHAWLSVAAAATSGSSSSGGGGGGNETTENTAATAISDTFDEFASLALLHKHFAVSIFGSHPLPFSDALRNMGVPVRAEASSCSGNDGDSAAAAVEAVWLAAAAVYKEALAPLAKKHPAVSKFVKSAVNRISSGAAAAAASLAPTSVQRKRCADSSPFLAFFVAIASGSGGDVCVQALLPHLNFHTNRLQQQQQQQEQKQEQEQEQECVVVGTVALRQGGCAGTLELSHMSVDQRYRRRGIGKLLLHQAVNFARSSGNGNCSNSEEVAAIANANVTANANASGSASARVASVNTTLELSVMTELEAAAALYLQQGFTAVGPPAPCATCKLQRMVLQL